MGGFVQPTGVRDPNNQAVLISELTSSIVLGSLLFWICHAGDYQLKRGGVIING